MILSVDIARKRLGGRTVLEALRFSLEAKEILAIVGPSGCGKTTLLRLIGGLDAEFDGTIDWRGSVPRVGTVFQEPRLLPWRSVRDNLRLVLPSDAGDGAIDLVLDRLGLAGFADHWASQLSLGMARRLALGRALVIEPGLLLLDEPFVSLDEALADSARQTLLELWRRRPVAAQQLLGEPRQDRKGDGLREHVQANGDRDENQSGGATGARRRRAATV